MTTNILYVCDNRDGPSWGGRGTSIALGQQLVPYGDVTGVGRDWATTPIPPGPVTGRVYRNRYGRKVLRRLVGRTAAQRTMHMLGSRTDYLETDPARSVARFRKAARADPELAELLRRFEAADTVVVNGEGSLIFRYPERRDLNFQLFAVALAAELGKPVGYVNALASDCPYSGTNPAVEEAVRSGLGRCTAVAARDPWSQRRLQELGLSQVGMVPDALFTWAQRYAGLLDSSTGRQWPELFDSWPESDRFLRGWSDWPAEYACVGATSRHPDQDLSHWPAFFESLVRRITAETGLPVVLFDPFDDDLLEEVARRTGSVIIRPRVNLLMAAYALGNAQVVVSGRFHPSIMASLRGTPCTFLAANAYKSGSLQEQLELPRPTVFPVEDSPENVAAIVAHAQEQLAGGEQLRAQIRGVSARLGEQAGHGMSGVMKELL